MSDMADALQRCPFVRAIADGRITDARTLAAQPPDPAEPVVIDWLVAYARRVVSSADPFDPDVCRVDTVHCDHYGAGEACCHCGETPPDDPEGDQ